jgi:hypothetical protein
MRKWYLIIAYLSTFSNDGSMTITSVGPFETWELCKAAGDLAEKSIEGTWTDIRFTCVDGGTVE